MALAELARFPTGINAEIAKGLLESHGIGAVTFDAGMNIADSAAIAIPVRLMVLDEDLSAAGAILEESNLV
ncbi:MAG: DUF2007 domain-containing protein [Sphingorhabdus sp.]